jgi:choloylglycine hydrolase
MKKSAALLLLFVFAIHHFLFACTTFFLMKNGQMVFGRNYDWVTATGMINTNLRGRKKYSLELEQGSKAQWVSKYGSVTFNQYGKEFPNGGMNEAGLVVELMWLDESKYPAPDNRPGLSVLQWIQYQLDNSRTVDEVIASDKKVRITSTGTPQHYLVADAAGNVATVEFLNGKMVVHSGKNLPYPVLANSTYESSLKNLNASLSNQKGVSFQSNSGDRFSKACSMIQQYQKVNSKKPLVDYSFDILNNVSQGSFTKWSIVYDITNKKIHFKSLNHHQNKLVDLASFNFSNNSLPLALNINTNTAGAVNNKFVAYSDEVNRKMLKQAFSESKSQVNIDDKLQNAVADLARLINSRAKA